MNELSRLARHHCSSGRYRAAWLMIACALQKRARVVVKSSTGDKKKFNLYKAICPSMFLFLLFTAFACYIGAKIVLSMHRLRSRPASSEPPALARPSLLAVGHDPLVVIAQSTTLRAKGLTNLACTCKEMLHAVLASGVKLQLDLGKTRLSR